MHEVNEGLIDEKDLHKIKEAVCLQVEKVYDSCKEKDCIEDLEVFGISKHLIKHAIDASCKEVEVEHVIIDVEPLKFRRGFYTVTVTYVFKVCVELFFRNSAPKVRCGVALFTKKVVLFGSQGRVKIFKAKSKYGRDIQYTPFLEQDNRPIGVVEVAEPICLSARIAEELEPSILGSRDIDIINSVLANIQSNVAVVDVDAKDNADVDVDINQTNVFNVEGGNIRVERKLVVTIGLFTIIKLTRLVQVLVPAFGFCNPPVCIEASTEHPCRLFETIPFPKEAFSPPQKQEVLMEEVIEEAIEHECGCGK